HARDGQHQALGQQRQLAAARVRRYGQLQDQLCCHLAVAQARANPFPSQLRAGRILYYDSIPDDVPSNCYDWTQSNSSITSGGSTHNERFWKEYIDWTLGVWKDPFGNQQGPQTPSCSIGPDFTWGTIQVSAKPSGGSPNAYMNYNDNPERPRH